MSNHEKVFAICENKCFEETLTKEQILEEGKYITDKTTGVKHSVRWLSRAEYDELDGYDANCEYHVYDEELYYSYKLTYTGELGGMILSNTFQEFNVDVPNDFFNNDTILNIHAVRRNLTTQGQPKTNNGDISFLTTYIPKINNVDIAYAQCPFIDEGVIKNCLIAVKRIGQRLHFAIIIGNHSDYINNTIKIDTLFLRKL